MRGCIGSVDKLGFCLMVSFEGCDYLEKKGGLLKIRVTVYNNSFVLNSAKLFFLLKVKF